MTDLFADTYTWMIISFGVFAIVLYKLGWPVMARGLDQKIASIKADVERAESLRAEANALLLEFEQRKRHAETEAEQIIATARAQAETLRARTEEQLAETMRRKEHQLHAHITLLRDQAVEQLRLTAADMAFHTARTIVETKLDDAARARLTESAIVNISQSLRS
jgi:F-type H+-transporting ATPase subunit b